MISFPATIYKIGINPVVDPPDNIMRLLFEQAGRERGPIPVHGRINGAEFIQTLVKYRGAWRLYINGEMLKAAGLSVGDRAEVEIAHDPRPREVPMPAQLAHALEKNAQADLAYRQLSPSRQKEILRYLGSLKSAETVERNVEKIVKHLLGEKVDTLNPLMRRK